MTATLEFRSLDLLSALDPANAGSGLRIQVVSGFLEPPAGRGTDYIVAAKVGRVSGNRVADVLSITLAGYVAGKDAATWRAFTDAWLAVLDENGVAAGALIARSPYLGLASGQAAISARVKNIMPGPIMAKLFQRWSIELESVEPYWSLS